MGCLEEIEIALKGPKLVVQEEAAECIAEVGTEEMAVVEVVVEVVVELGLAPQTGVVPEVAFVPEVELVVGTA